MASLGNNLRRAGRFAESKEILKAALNELNHKLNPDHPLVLNAMANLAKTLFKLDELPYAISLQKEVLQLRRKVLGVDHSATLRVMEALGSSYDKSGKTDDAEKLFDEFFDITHRMLDRAHELSCQGKHVESRQLNERVLKVFQENLGPEHEETLVVNSNLAIDLAMVGNLNEALKIQKRVLEVRIRELGNTDPQTLLAMKHLAITHFKLKDFEAARPLEEGIIEISRQLHGDDSEEVAESMEELANTLDEFDVEEAVRIRSNALRILRNIAVKRDPESVQAMDSLTERVVECLQSLGHTSTKIDYDKKLSSATFGPLFVEGKKNQYEGFLAVSIRELQVEVDVSVYVNAMDDPVQLKKRVGRYVGNGITQLQIVQNDSRIKFSMSLGFPDFEIPCELFDHMLGTGIDELDALIASGSQTDPISSFHLTAKENSLRLTDILKQWLNEQEWDDEPEIDEKTQSSSTGFNFTVGDFSLKCWFDINENTEVFKFYAYFLDTKVPEKKLDEVQKFVIAVSNDMLLGNLQLLREDRTIRYYNGIDVENATFEPAHITNMLNAGVSAMGKRLPQYMTICFGGMTAEDVLAEE